MIKKLYHIHRNSITSQSSNSPYLESQITLNQDSNLITFWVSFRSQKPKWDYNAEVQAFSSRLNESFLLELLKTAFVNPCYLQAELVRRQGLGLDVNATALHLKDNADLSMKGVGFTSSFLADFCKTSFPKLPSKAVESIISHLTSPVVVAKVARNLSIEDLTMSAHFPVPEEVLHATFMAVVGALLESSGSERAGLFVRVCCFDGWVICLFRDNIFTHVCIVWARMSVYMGVYIFSSSF